MLRHRAGAPVRMAQIRARRAVQGEVFERHPRLFAELAQIQAEINIQRQAFRRDLIEHG